MSDVNPYAPPETEEPSLVEEHDLILPSVMNYASRWQRLFGALIDGVIYVLILTGIVMATGAFVGVSWDDDQFWDRALLADGVIGTISLYVGYILVQGYFWHTRGQSIGKILTGTRIVMLNGQQASFKTILFKRTASMWLISWIPVIGDLISTIDGLLIFRREKNCLHDDFAGTRVIRVNATR